MTDDDYTRADRDEYLACGEPQDDALDGAAPVLDAELEGLLRDIENPELFSLRKFFNMC